MKKKYIIVLHVTFWILFEIMPILSIYLHGEKVPMIWHIKLLASAIFDIFNFYICYIFINPNEILKNNIKNSIILMSFSLIYTFIRIIMTLVFYYYAGVELQKVHVTTGVIIQEFVNTLIYTIFALFIKLILDWFQTRQLQSELLAQNKASELALLKSQINPHFLFNTLNNIYSLVYKKDDEAPQAIMKLSEIMRYMLYDSNTDLVPLENEVNYLKSYIEIQLLRIKNKDFLKFDIIGDISEKQICPMLLIPFIENAFKHGDKQVESPGIEILLKADTNTITFEVKNYFTDNINKDKVGGIGLNNIERRLMLLYPDKHKFTIEKQNNIFYTKLEISI